MTPPLVYNYDAGSGVYLGREEAVQSPLDFPGVWLIPASATLIAPPDPPFGQVAVYSPIAKTWTTQPA